MELQFQQEREKNEGQLSNTTNYKMRGSRSGSGSGRKSKFVGVRQRPSGKWVAEIKNTTQKIRIWLGTFDNAEEAARAYDEAACLLRGSNTRTNFVHSSTHTTNSALSQRIRNLVNHKRSLLNNCQSTESESDPPTASPSPTTYYTTQTQTSLLLNQAINTASITSQFQTVDHEHHLDHNNLYRSLDHYMVGQFEFDYAWPPFPQQLSESPIPGLSPKHMMSFAPNSGTTNEEVVLPEFERLKVERQISASLYAMNGVNDYLETVFNHCNSNDQYDPTWDLHLPMQMLHQPFWLG